MGYNTAFTGEFTVEPPLSWPEIQRSPSWPGHPSHNDRGFRRDFYGAHLHVTEEEVNTNEGTLIRRRCGRVTIEGDELRSDAVLNSLRRLARDFGDRHEFVGVIDAGGEEPGDVWRIRIVGREVHEIRPVLLWPLDEKAIKIIADTTMRETNGETGECVKLAELIMRRLADGLTVK
jgi:hypothetical protein